MWASQLTRWEIILSTPALVKYWISSSSASFPNGGVSPRQKNYSRVVSALEEIYGVNSSCLSQGSRFTRVKICNYKLIKNSKHLQEHVSLIPTTRENRKYFRAGSLKWRSKMKWISCWKLTFTLLTEETLCTPILQILFFLNRKYYR